MTPPAAPPDTTSTPRARVSVGIVNHDGARYLPATLRAIAAHGPILDDILVVDNGSTDDSPARARAFPGVRLIELGANRGPGAARNIALREAAHDRVLLLDNDVIPQPGCVGALAAALDARPLAVMAMPAVLDAADPSVVQYVGADAHVLGTCALRSAGERSDGLGSEAQSVSSAVTACVLVDRARFGDRAWFDEALFLYLEDHEMGLRARLLGFELLAVPAARCVHDVGTVGVSVRETGRFTPVRVEHTMLNRWQVLLKLYQTRTLLFLLPVIALFEAFQIAGALRRLWIGHWLRAVGRLVRGGPDLWRRRRAFQAMRRVDDLEVITGGPFPYNRGLRAGPVEQAARRVLDTAIDWNWRLAIGRRRWRGV